MSTIGTTTFVEDGNRNYFTLQNEQYLRKFNPRTWTKMTIGVLFSIDATASFSGGLWVGILSSGNQAGPGTVGIKNGTSAITMSVGNTSYMFGSLGYGVSYNKLTYNNTDISGSSFTAGAIFVSAMSKSAQIGSAGNAVPCYFATTESIARKSIMTCDFIKTTATNVNIIATSIINYTGSSGTNVNHTDLTLCDSLLNIPFIINGTSQYHPGPGTNLTPLNDIDYPLNTVNICATGSAIFRIYQIAVRIS